MDAAPSDAGTDIEAGRSCARDLDCDDALFCNGAERCVEGVCAPGEAITCDDGDACTADACSEDERGACIHVPVDADGDGHVDAACGGDDCDDTDPHRFPGNTEICDLEGHDEDCDPRTFGFRDLDGDGAVDARCCNTDASGERFCGTDCDDVRPSVRPGAAEVCNRIDDDCDGAIDEGVSIDLYVDDDRDLHGAPGIPIKGCPGMVGFSPVPDDCDDRNAHRHGAMVELCDGIDNDCDGEVDETPTEAPWYRDADGDGFGATHATPVWSCAPLPGHSLLPTDCDDSRAAISPRAAELCDALDNDCNGWADFEIAPGDFEDDDGDGIPDAACAIGVADCDDRDPLRADGSPEICDGRDNDCDGAVDENVSMVVWLRDRDGDGYGGEAGGGRIGCEPVEGFVARAGDCDDGNPNLRPGATELCNHVDDDCDGTVDEGSDASCEVPGGEGRCVAGQCAIGACALDRADCDGIFANGCERALGTETDCGGCGDACDAGEACVAGRCRQTCTDALDCAGLACCGGACFDTTRDIRHCGGCDAPCALGGLCVAGACEDACVPSEETCNGADDDCDGLIDDGVCACGDGRLDAGEVCDDGNVVSGDGCSADCRSDETCGNGVLDLSRGEECDDGNAVSGDGCSALCVIEIAECGNGVEEPGELCDDGPGGPCADDCQALCGNLVTEGLEVCDDGPGGPCSDDCQALCGNGAIEPGEACDDGNLTDGDGCSGMCTAACGDGFLDVGWEVCDDGNVASGDGCSADCTSACGDGVLDPTEGEVCDDGNTVSGDGCSADCRAACGNGITEGPEECDDGNTVDFDGCSSVCVIELPECGNGVEEPGETCDDGNLVSGDGCGATCISECGVASSAQVVGTAGGTIVAMEADAAGNVYVLVDQPRGPVTYGSTTIDNADLEPDTVLWSLTSTGAHRWLMHAGGTSGWAKPYDLAIDASGNLYVTGVVLGGSVTFGSTTITPGVGNRDVFVWALTSDGTHRWAISDGSATGAEEGRAVTVDETGNVYVGGTYVVNTTLGGVALTGGQGYVWSLTSSGATRWAASGGPVHALAYGGGAVGRVYALGTFTSGTMNVGPYVVTSAGGSDVAVWAHDASDGAMQWALSGGGAGAEAVFDATVDASGNLYAGVQSNGSATFGSASTPAGGGDDVVVWSLDGTGATRWVARSAGSQDERGSHLAMSGATVYAVGTLAQGSGAFGAASLSGNDGEGFVVSASTASGAWTCARSFGGQGDDSGAALAASHSGLAIMGGSESSDFLVGGSTTLGPGRIFFRIDP